MVSRRQRSSRKCCDRLCRAHEYCQQRTPRFPRRGSLCTAGAPQRFYISSIGWHGNRRGVRYVWTRPGVSKNVCDGWFLIAGILCDGEPVPDDCSFSRAKYPASSHKGSCVLHIDNPFRFLQYLLPLGENSKMKGARPLDNTEIQRVAICFTGPYEARNSGLSCSVFLLADASVSCLA